MRARNDVSPTTLPVDLRESGVAVEYRDGREVFYHGVPERTGSPVRTAGEVDVHVLVTGPDGQEGVLTYVNDRRTHDDVLESTGVGRVLLGDGDGERLFPGVVVRAEGRRVVVEVEFDAVDGRVFVFEENQLGERSREVVPDADSEGSAGRDRTNAGDETGGEP